MATFLFFSTLIEMTENPNNTTLTLQACLSLQLYRVVSLKIQKALGLWGGKSDAWMD